MVVITFQTINKNDHYVLFGKEVGSQKRDDISFIEKGREEAKARWKKTVVGFQILPALEFELRVG